MALIASDIDIRNFASFLQRVRTTRDAARLIQKRIDSGKLVLSRGDATSWRLLMLGLDDIESDARGIGEHVGGENWNDFNERPVTAAAAE